MLTKYKESDNTIQILNDFPDGIIVLSKDGKTEFANKQAIQLLGGKEDVLYDQNLGIPLDLHHSIELDLVSHSKNQPLVAELKMAKTKWNGEDSYIASLRDITDEKNEQDIIETVFQAFSVLQEGFFICNDSGAIIYANPAFEKITGYSRKDIYGKSPSFLKSGVHTEEFYDDFYSKLTKEGEWSGIIWNKRANGEVYPENLSISSIYKEEGTVKFYVAIFTDVTEYMETSEKLKKSHQEALESDKKKTEFLSKASHEIRAPMSGIIGYSELLAETNLTTEQREYLEVIRSSSKSLLNMINELLDISKLQSNKKTQAVSVFSIRDLVQELYKFFKVHTAKKPVVLGHHFSGNIPEWVEGEKEPLRQVLTNLLSNAFKFTESGRISFGVDLVDDLDDIIKIHFSVTDTGVGVEERYIHKIFDPFFQVENVKQDPRLGSGSGLGLAIVKSIVEKNGGSIQFESEIGKGTKVKFSFVLKKTDKQGEAVEILKQNSIRLEKWKNRGRSLSVLLAEDNYPNQMYIKRMLEKNNIFVVLASTGEQVLHRIRDKEFDAILMDIRMPKLNGIDATKEIRKMKDKKISQIPIIALTGLTSEEERISCKEAGMNGFLMKPIEAEKLIFEILKHVFP
jgi:PAS domain S-box-containing protein